MSSAKALQTLFEVPINRFDTSLSNRASTRPIAPKILHEDFEVPEEPIFIHPTVNDRAEQSLTISQKQMSRNNFSSLRDIQNGKSILNQHVPREDRIKVENKIIF